MCAVCYLSTREVWPWISRTLQSMMIWLQCWLLIHFWDLQLTRWINGMLQHQVIGALRLLHVLFTWNISSWYCVLLKCERYTDVVLICHVILQNGIDLRCVQVKGASHRCCFVTKIGHWRLVGPQSPNSKWSLIGPNFHLKRRWPGHLWVSEVSRGQDFICMVYCSKCEVCRLE